jgi:SAM-dependent methyltransferase
MQTDFFECLICHGHDLAVSDDAWVCRECKQVYPVKQQIPLLVRDWRLHEEEIKQAGEIKPSWFIDEQPPEAESPWRHHLEKRRRYVEDAIARYLKQNNKSHVEKMLDLGCGDGNNIAYLKKFSKEMFAREYNLRRLVRANKANPQTTFFLADLLDYPVGANYFDIVFFNHVLEHIPDDDLALENLYRILAPQGLLVLGVPNEGAWWWQLAYTLQPRTRKTTDHVHFYKAPDLAAKLTAHGFTLLEVKHIGWGLPHWTIDSYLRRYKAMDDLFDLLGRLFIPHQASSIYLLAAKT